MKVLAKIATVLLLNIFANAWAANSELPPAVFLNRLSQRLIGQGPTPVEFENLKNEMQRLSCSTNSCLDGFFRQYIKTKMNHSLFYNEAILKIYDHFGYRLSDPFQFENLAFPKGQNFTSDINDQNFIYNFLSNNLSFDSLYISQSKFSVITGQGLYAYDSSNPISSGIQIVDTLVPGEIRKTNIKVPQMPSDIDTANTMARLQSVQFKETIYEGHPNVSGLFSSKKFLNRYWNSPVNQNRKRAAAFFNIMLCDSMNPALERTTQTERENNIALGRAAETHSKTVDEIRQNRHANQKDCAMCHNRLDPIAKIFRPFEGGIDSTSFGGELNMNTGIDEMKKISVNNFHDLTTKTVRQTKYLDCQVGWLIDTYLGKDLQIHPQRYNQIVNQIENQGRRIKDTIEILLMTPEFRGMKSEVLEHPLYTSAKDVIRNCTECHGNFLNGRPEKIKEKLGRISVCLDLANDGKDRAMPPSSHYWDPSAEEILSIKKWISSGAPLSSDSNNSQNILTGEEVNKVLNPPKGVRKCRN